MNSFGGPECSFQGDLNRGSFVPASLFHVEIPNEVFYSGSVHHYSEGPPHTTNPDELGYPRLDNDLGKSRMYCDPLSQCPLVPYPDYLLCQAAPYHFMNPPVGLCKNTLSTWTPEEAFPYWMTSAEMHEGVASITSEGADEHCKQTCSRQESVTELLDMGHNVVCNVNDGGQMMVLNHCSPNQIIQPMVQDQSTPNPDPLLYTADHSHSPERCLTQETADSPLPKQVQRGFSSPMYLSSLTSSNVHPSSNSNSSTPSYNFTLGTYISPSSCTELPKPGGVESSETQSVRERLKKPCNCTRSQCLKLYCDCFASGEVCSNCNCTNCCNNMEHKSERYRAMKICLKRNPKAFHPKTGIRKVGDVKSRHTKGCNCKRSGCLKNYCECYEAKIMCSSTCKCIGCRNYDGSPVRELTGRETPNTPENSSGLHKCPLSCITPDVVEATCGCLLAQAEEAERERHTQPHAERMILEEFGQCLTQIVRSMFKSTGVQ
ncbi:spexin prohormone 2 [Astyanax mexicanus]|uniref:spexin prohormone 2 n=1 Tax=Astyanax mexicanus TaxID=7994 RepID=UPI0020CB1C1A|nr:spexin prohormone 2 [Astyanax mexicanus]XP_022539666.2 spexin prohormone 2 [Astyanax mexicanus]